MSNVMYFTHPIITPTLHKEMPVSNIKNLFEQIAEKFGANPNIQVIQGTNLEDVIAQLKAEIGDVAEIVGATATKAVDGGVNAVQALIDDLNAQFGGEKEITHRELSLEELEQELIAILKGEGEFLADDEDERVLGDLSKEELMELVSMQDQALDLATETLVELRAQAESQAEQIVHLEATVGLQSQLLESSNEQLTAMHEGVAQLRGMLETLKGANARVDAAQDRTRTISFADILSTLGKR